MPNVRNNLYLAVGECCPANEDAYKYAGANANAPTVSTYYHNHTGVTISIVTRAGLRMSLPSITTSDRREFTVREEYSIPRAIAKDFFNMFAQMEDRGIKDELMFYRLKQSYNFYKDSPVGPWRVILDYSFTIDSIRNKDTRPDGFYLSTVDLVVSELPVEIIPDHPFATYRQFATRYNNLVGSEKGLSFTIELVDNDNKYRDRYMYFANAVHLVRPINDSTRENGIHYGIIIGDEVKYQHMSVEEGEKYIGLYKTQEEALVGGDISAAINKELVEAQRLLNQEKAEYARKELEHKAQVAELEQRAKSLEHQNKLLEEEVKTRKLIRDDYNNSRTSERDEHTSFIKFASTIILTVIGTWAVMQKKSS